MKDVKNRRMTLMAQIWLVNPCGPVKMSTVFTAENSERHLEFNICLEVYTNIKAHSFLTSLPHNHMKNRDKSQLVDFMTSYVFLEYMNINCYFMYHKTQRKTITINILAQRSYRIQSTVLKKNPSTTYFTVHVPGILGERVKSSPRIIPN